MKSMIKWFVRALVYVVARILGIYVMFNVTNFCYPFLQNDGRVEQAWPFLYLIFTFLAILIPWAVVFSLLSVMYFIYFKNERIHWEEVKSFGLLGAGLSAIVWLLFALQAQMVP